MDKIIYKSHLYDQYFQLVKKGIKTIEVRLNDEKRKNMKVGNYIEFINMDKDETIMTEIMGKREFDSLEDLYDFYDEKSLGISKKDIRKVMENIYSKEELSSNNICALEIKII